MLAIVGFFSSILAGLGVTALVPLFSLILNKGNSSGKITVFVTKFFSFLPFSYNARSLLTFIIILFIVRGILLFVFSYIREQVRYRYRGQAMEELLQKLLHTDWPFLLTQKLGFVQNIILRDVDQSSVFLDSFSKLLLTVITAAVLSAFAINLSLHVTLIALAIGMIMPLLFRPLMKRGRLLGLRLSKAEKKVSHYLAEHMIGMKTVKTSAAETQVLKQGMDYFSYWKSLELQRVLVRALRTSPTESIGIIFISVLFVFSYRSPGFSLEAFIATIYLINKIFALVEAGQAALHQMSEAIPYIEDITEFRETLDEHQEIYSTGKPFALTQALTFEQVAFAYPKLDPILRDISFSIHRGEWVGLVGPSGTGKTTIGDLAMRLFKPSSGSMLLDGTAVEAYELESWRRAIGYVSQDVFLLDETIENNIRFYNTTITQEEIIDAAKKANIYNFIQSLPRGFATIVGERGVMLSGGQRQRIVLARVLARKPSVLILDEATSALDNESEMLIQQAIASLRGSVTVLMIAHRLSTLLDANRVLVLDHGRIVEEGAPQELLEKPTSYFYRMYHLKEVVTADETHP